MESNRSVDVFGVRIRVKEAERACRKAAFVAKNGESVDWKHYP